MTAASWISDAGGLVLDAIGLGLDGGDLISVSRTAGRAAVTVSVGEGSAVGKRSAGRKRSVVGRRSGIGGGSTSRLATHAGNGRCLLAAAALASGTLARGALARGAFTGGRDCLISFM